jgi:hypothetical protein
MAAEIRVLEKQGTPPSETLECQSGDLLENAPVSDNRSEVS